MTAPDERPLTDFLMNMNLEPGASEQEIAELEKKLKLSLPDSYKSILRFTNGAGGCIGPEELLLYSIDQVVDANARFQAFRDGLLIFGSDGRGEAYVFDTAGDWSVGMIPWISIGRNELVPMGHTLHAFFTILQNNLPLGRI